jgi:hypothetical protein
MAGEYRLVGCGRDVRVVAIALGAQPLRADTPGMALLRRTVMPAIGLGTCVVVAPAPAAPSTDTCSRPHSRTILQTAQVRVASASGTMRACWRPTGRAFTVGDAYGCDKDGFGCGGARRFRVAGAVLAYEASSLDHYGNSSYEVVVTDVRRGKRLRRVATGPLTPEQANPSDRIERHEGVGPVTALVVRSDGAVAWIARDLHADAGVSYVVRALIGRHSTGLADGADIAPRSLRLAGSTLSWTQRGQRRSAPLA